MGSKELPKLNVDGPDSEDEEEPGSRTEIGHAVRLGVQKTTRPWLLVVGGVRSLGCLVRVRNNMIIGRGPEADFLLDELGVSRQHAKVQLLVGDVVRISDLDSSNGVRVDGVKMKSHVLRDGERVRLGDATLTLVRMDDDPATMRKNLVASLERPSE